MGYLWFLSALLVNFSVIFLHFRQAFVRANLCKSHAQWCENGGTCLPDGDWARCLCADGFRGEQCEIDVRLNATACTPCTVTCAGGTKYCARLYTFEADTCTKGTHCKKKTYARVAVDTGVNIYTTPCNTAPCPVNGVYAPWARWSDCSSTCGEGIRQRTRTCTPPRFGGEACVGESTNRTFCNIGACPAVRRVPKQFLATPSFKQSDRRTTAVGIGVVGIVSIAFVGGLIAYLDVMSFCLARQMKKSTARKRGAKTAQDK